MKIYPLKAIRLHCRECQEGTKAVRLCDRSECALHMFRMGKNPNRAGIGRRDGVFRRKSPAQS